MFAWMNNTTLKGLKRHGKQTPRVALPFTQLLWLFDHRMFPIYFYYLTSFKSQLCSNFDLGTRNQRRGVASVTRMPHKRFWCDDEWSKSTAEPVIISAWHWALEENEDSRPRSASFACKAGHQWVLSLYHFNFSHRQTGYPAFGLQAGPH